MMSSQHPYPATMLSINVLQKQMFPFKNFNHMLIFVILIRDVNTSCSKVAQKAESCSESQKLLRKPKVAQGC